MAEEQPPNVASKNPTARKTQAPTKLVISRESVASAEVDLIVSQMEEAKRVPLVRNIGEPEKTAGGLRVVAWLILSGACGGFLTWGAWELSVPLFDDSETATASNLFSSLSVAFLIGMSLVIGDTLQSGALSKMGSRIGIGLAAALVLGLLLGFAASTAYGAGVERIFDDLFDSGLSISDPDFFDEFNARNHLNRGIAWSFIGLAAGLTVGIASMLWKRILITGGGGLIGGFLGGFLFDYFVVLGDDAQSENAAQISGLLITGLVLGGVISLSEEVAKTSWIEITHGGMAGKQFILYKNSVSLGSSPSADITLIKDSTMPAIAATLEKQGGVMIVSVLDAQSPLFVNGVESLKSKLGDSDTVSIGKTGIRYRERGQRAVSSGIVRN
jgi:hypothetical protein